MVGRLRLGLQANVFQGMFRDCIYCPKPFGTVSLMPQLGISSRLAGRDDCVRNVGNQSTSHRPGT
jgi:hypothetical protein